MTRNKAILGRLTAGFALVSAGAAFAYVAVGASATAESPEPDISALRAAQVQDDIVPADYNPRGTLDGASTRLVGNTPDGRVWVGLSDEMGICVLAELRSDTAWTAGLTCDTVALFNASGLQIALEQEDEVRQVMLIPDAAEMTLQDDQIDKAGLEREAPNLLRVTGPEFRRVDLDVLSGAGGRP